MVKHQFTSYALARYDIDYTEIMVFHMESCYAVAMKFSRTFKALCTTQDQRIIEGFRLLFIVQTSNCKSLCDVTS